MIQSSYSGLWSKLKPTERSVKPSLVESFRVGLKLRVPRSTVDAAWSHIVELIHDTHTPKPLLLAAISAVGSIRPAEAGNILVDLADSEDEEIAEAADEAMAAAEVASDEEDDEEDKWIN